MNRSNFALLRQALQIVILIIIGFGAANTAGAVVSVSVGQYHACAVNGASAVRCWGNGDEGQLGNGKSGYGYAAYLPVQASGLTSGVIAIAAGYKHSCALTTAGGVKCWGSNSGGELGHGSGERLIDPAQ